LHVAWSAAAPVDSHKAALPTLGDESLPSRDLQSLSKIG
jgi:hypothetical protein